jgi:dTDP-4-amino-4,6-dideoxygalactose transaminase
MSDLRQRDEPIPYARPYSDAAEIAAVREALESGMWTNGAYVGAFEQELAAVTGTTVVALSSGTAAIHALLLALTRRMEAPRLLVTPALTFAATTASAFLTGWDVGLCDVDPDDLTVSPASLHELLERVAHAYAHVLVVPLHYAGHACDMAAVSGICDRFGASIVEDACHAVGGEYGGAQGPIGSWPASLAAFFSFHPTKPVASAEGGAVATRDADLAGELRLLRNHNMAPVTPGDDLSPWPYDIAEPGLNLRLSDVHAAIGFVQTRRLAETRLERRRLAARYYELLRDVPAVEPVPSALRDGSAHHLFPVRFDLASLGLAKHELIAALHGRGIRAQVHYTPLHRLTAFGEIDPGLRTSLDVTDRAFAGLLSLPLWYGMSEGQQDRVVEAVAAIATWRG